MKVAELIQQLRALPADADAVTNGNDGDGMCALEQLRRAWATTRDGYFYTEAGPDAVGAVQVVEL